MEGRADTMKHMKESNFKTTAADTPLLLKELVDICAVVRRRREMLVRLVQKHSSFPCFEEMSLFPSTPKPNIV